jgi:hypothetical protein
MLALMIGNVVISEVDALTYVVLSEVEKHALWGISWYRRMFDVISEVSNKLRLLEPSSTVKEGPQHGESHGQNEAGGKEETHCTKMHTFFTLIR